MFDFLVTVTYADSGEVMSSTERTIRLSAPDEGTAVERARMIAAWGPAEIEEIAEVREVN